MHGIQEKQMILKLGNAFSANINNVSMLIYGDPMVRAFDIAGHEFTHAVTSSESNLEFFGESGQLMKHYLILWERLLRNM